MIRLKFHITYQHIIVTRLRDFRENWRGENLTFLTGVNKTTIQRACSVKPYDILRTRKCFREVHVLGYTNLNNVIKETAFTAQYELYL